MFLLDLVIDLKAKRETVWHRGNFVDRRITFKPNLFLGRKTTLLRVAGNYGQFEPFSEIFDSITIRSFAKLDIQVRYIS